MSLARFDDVRSSIEAHVGPVAGGSLSRGEAELLQDARDRMDALMMAVEYVRETSNWTNLIRAAVLNDVDEVKRSLDECGRKDISGKTALMRAAMCGHAEVARVLVEYEARAKDRKGRDALYYALKSGNLEVARIIMEHDDLVSKNGDTALMKAADRTDVELARLLIPFQKARMAKGAVKVGELEVRQGTALMRAAAHGHAEMVELLVEHEGGVRGAGWPALMLAAQCNCFGIRSNSPLVDYPRCVELLMGYEGNISGWTELTYAAYRGDTDAVRNNLHMKGRQDIEGWTALMYAAARGHETIVELLKQEARMKNNNHQTALMWAARSGCSECVRLLLEEEGGMQTFKGWTALMNAARGNNVECARLLTEKEKGKENNKGMTALMHAAMSGHADIVRLLLAHEKGMKDNRGKTARMIAMSCGHSSIADLLSEYE